MKKTFALTSAIAIAMITTPAAAQVFGGSGTILGGAGGSLDSTIGGIDRTVNSTTRGTLETRGSTDGNTRIDRRKGRVEVDRRADASLTGNADQLLTSPLGQSNAQASGSRSASGNSSASAQLIGTDAVTNTAGQLRSRATDAAGATRSAAGRAVGSARSTASGAAGQVLGAASVAGALTGNGSAMGSADGSATGSAMSNMLAVAGSGASQVEGSFGIAPGMDVLAPSGARIGQVREIVADQRGQVQQVLVSTGGAKRLVSAGEFSSEGNALVMGSAGASGSTRSAQKPASQTNEGVAP